MSGTPEWLDDKGKIIEHRYCQCFLEKHSLRGPLQRHNTSLDAQISIRHKLC